MSKRLKTKKEKVPKLTEEEYVQYISTLKGMEETRLNSAQSGQTLPQAVQKPLQN